jgi:hypothetical protein
MRMHNGLNDGGLTRQSSARWKYLDTHRANVRNLEIVIGLCVHAMDWSTAWSFEGMIIEKVVLTLHKLMTVRA